MINFIRGFLFMSRSIYGKLVMAGSVNLTGIETVSYTHLTLPTIA